MIQARPVTGSESAAVANQAAANSPIDRIVGKIRQGELPGREHFESYMLQKWRMNHKPSTLKGSSPQ